MTIFNNLGWVYTETRTYAKGYQITNTALAARGGVIAETFGSFTYDTNNNMLTSKGVTIFEGTTQYAFRENWTFEFDRKNRMINFTHANTDDKRYLWYDGRGRVWQRWTYDTAGEGYWNPALNRYVYDGGSLAQEHVFDVEESEGSWVYSYDDLERDYLRKPGGTRQIERSGGTDTHQFLLEEGGTPTARIGKDLNSSVERMELTASGERQATGSTQDTPISNIGPGGGYIEGYAATAAQVAYFDPLMKMGGRHFLPGLGRFVNRLGNHPYAVYEGPIDTMELPPTPLLPPIKGDPWGYVSKGIPELPLPDFCCTGYYYEELADHLTGRCQRCTEPLIFRRVDWFDFCCDPNCRPTGSMGIEPACGSCDCYGLSCGRDCLCDHCDWSFGFSSSGFCSYPIIDSSCDGKLADPSAINFAFEDMCKALSSCACSIHRDRTAQYSIYWQTVPSYMFGEWRSGNYKGVLGCLADMCRGSLPLRITCFDCFKGDAGAIPLPGGAGIINLCMNNLSPSIGGCRLAHLLLHEALHLCGVNWDIVYETIIWNRSQSVIPATYFISDYCIDPGLSGRDCFNRSSYVSFPTPARCNPGEPCY